jgi:hypothetical protein
LRPAFAARAVGAGIVQIWMSEHLISNDVRRDQGGGDV